MAGLAWSAAPLPRMIRGSEALRAAVDVFEPLQGPLAALSARVKSGFDPHRVLNPGRMYAGI
jgi:glycolate oxidase FAD binding subunit